MAIPFIPRTHPQGRKPTYTCPPGCPGVDDPLGSWDDLCPRCRAVRRSRLYNSTTRLSDPLYRAKSRTRNKTRDEHEAGRLPLAERCWLCLQPGPTDFHHWSYHKPDSWKDVASVHDSCHRKIHGLLRRAENATAAAAERVAS